MSDAAAACGLGVADVNAAGVVDDGGADASHPASNVAPDTAVVAFQFINKFTAHCTLSAFRAARNRIRLCYDSPCTL